MNKTINLLAALTVTTLLLTTACNEDVNNTPTQPQGKPIEVEFQIPGFSGRRKRCKTKGEAKPLFSPQNEPQ